MTLRHKRAWQSIRVSYESFCLTFKQAQPVKRSREAVVSAARGCMASSLPPPASELVSTLGVCATPHCATSFPHSPPLCLISPSLSSRASACPRDSEPLNIHPFTSIAPLVLLEEGEGGYDIELFRAQSGYFWRLYRLR